MLTDESKFLQMPHLAHLRASLEYRDEENLQARFSLKIQYVFIKDTPIHSSIPLSDHLSFISCTCHQQLHEITYKRILFFSVSVSAYVSILYKFSHFHLAFERNTVTFNITKKMGINIRLNVYRHG